MEDQALREFAEVLRGRRTINVFLQTPVPESLIHEAIEVAVWAPNHHVTEPWRFHILGMIPSRVVSTSAMKSFCRRKARRLPTSNGKIGPRSQVGWSSPASVQRMNYYNAKTTLHAVQPS